MSSITYFFVVPNQNDFRSSVVFCHKKLFWISFSIIYTLFQIHFNF